MVINSWKFCTYGYTKQLNQADEYCKQKWSFAVYIIYATDQLTGRWQSLA
jgi:hypothetical protein